MQNIIDKLGQNGSVIPFTNDLWHPSNSRKNIDFTARSVAVFAIPYYSPLQLGGNLAAFATIPDYHISVIKLLEPLVLELQNTYPKEQFRLFTDISPIKEVYTAVSAGLGVLGQNGLLLTEKYGSFVFIAEIISSLETNNTRNEIKSCIGCGACRTNCPSSALSGGFNKLLCASFITQKQTSLTKSEQQIIAKAAYCYGCDICALCCPYNKSIDTGREEIAKDVIKSVTFENWRCFEGRAFSYKGAALLLRNLQLITQKEPNEHTIL